VEIRKWDHEPLTTDYEPLTTNFSFLLSAFQFFSVLEFKDVSAFQLSKFQLLIWM
jgi:hypothetical protein